MSNTMLSPPVTATVLSDRLPAGEVGWPFVLSRLAYSLAQAPWGLRVLT